ncbi:MAG: hypothetical protein ABIQ39_14305 [Ilumatobacteraceae bacterium]
MHADRDENTVRFELRKRIAAGRTSAGRRGATDASAHRDEGSMLVLALVLIIVGSLIVLPIMDYAMAVSRSSRMTSQKSIAAEAARGGLRTALADPTSLYKKCGYTDANNPGAGLYRAVQLASPGLSTSVTTNCYMMSYGKSTDGGSYKNWAVASLQVGSTIPQPIKDNEPRWYPSSGQSPESAWYSNDFTAVPTLDKVWLPYLPAHALNRRAASGYPMPAGFNGFPACTVYFPGTYTDPLVISGSTPVFFTSGIYYFENTVKITGDANVVVGGGAVSGCASDQEAVFYATGAPALHNISGLGATFVFGAGGRLVVDTSVAGNAAKATSIAFNQRYVATNDVSTATSAGVSIMSVNGRGTDTGSTPNFTDFSDLNMPGQLYVPKGQVQSQTLVDATSQDYKPSTLTPAAVAPPAPPSSTTTVAGPTTTTIAVPPPVQTAVVEVNLTTTKKINVSIPGYVSVPQGLMRVTTAVGAEANKTVSIAGGILAASIELNGVFPTMLGLANPVVQQTFKLVSQTTGNPKVTATAIVQINQNGAWKVNDFVVQ